VECFVLGVVVVVLVRRVGLGLLVEDVAGLVGPERHDLHRYRRTSFAGDDDWDSSG
jgi:hypothetical protein